MAQDGCEANPGGGSRCRDSEPARDLVYVYFIAKYTDRCTMGYGSACAPAAGVPVMNSRRLQNCPWMSPELAPAGRLAEQRRSSRSADGPRCATSRAGRGG